MKVIFQDPGYEYSSESFAEFIKQGPFWSESIFHFFPELEEFRGAFSTKIDNKVITKEILDAVFKIYESRKAEIRNKVTSYQETWNHYEELINNKFSSIFQFDTRNLFNDLVCNITLNPISPRYLETHTFDVFYMNSSQGSIGVVLHEIAHFLWFHLWHQKNNDSFELYESPTLIWVLSEAVIEQLLNNDDFNRVNPYSKSGCAYPYFYEMNINNRKLYDYLNEMFKENNLQRFMEMSYQFMIDNENEIRAQMLE